ncbi:MAG: serine hydrolase domain-containing protein [Verrucomicrobiota bacterium]
MNHFPRTIPRRTFLGLALATPLAFSSMAEDAARPTPEDLKDLLAKIREESGLPAIAVAAMRDGVLLALGAVGVRKMGSPATVTASDKFHTGSCTKAMTATLIAMFVESGKLAWEKTLADIFPERAAKMNEHYQKVTLEALLHHRSGSRANAGFNSPKQPLVTQRLAYLDSVVNNAPEFKAGDYHYSNAGYIMLGAVLERVTGQPWETIIQQRLFRPLGMKSAGFGPPSRPNHLDQPWGHVLKDGKFQSRYSDNPAGLGPAGTVHCAMADYMKFADFHASLGKRPPGLLNADSFATLHRPPAGASYAKGWGTGKRTWAKGRILSHSGSNTMNLFVVWIAPEINFSVAAATNAVGEKTDAVLDKVIGELVRKYAG